MRSRKLSLFLSAVLLISLFAGCAAPAANTGATAGQEAAATEAATEAAEAAPAGPFEPMSLAAPDCEYGGEFKSIEAVDELTVKFTLCYPDPAFPAKVAFSAFGINDADYLEATGGGGDLIENPNGTGPYKFVEWRRGDQIILERNDEFWGTPAIPQTVVFRWSPESAQRLVELQSGTVDGIDNPGPDDFATIQNDSSLQLATRNGTNVFYLGMNDKFPPFDNERVRQAFAMAIDRQRIVDNFYPPGSTVADQFMPTSIFGYTPESKPFPNDLEMAKKIDG